MSIPAKLKPYLESLPKTGPWSFTAPPGRKYPQGGHGINTKHLNEDFSKILDADRRQGGAEDGRVLNPPSQIAHQHRLMEPRETFRERGRYSRRVAKPVSKWDNIPIW